MTDTQGATLDASVLVAPGFQPYRKLFHATNCLLIAGGLAVLELTRPQQLAILGGIVGALVLFDLVRLRLPALNALFLTAFRRLASAREAEGVASSTWYALGVFLAVLLAPVEVAVSAILVLGLADPVASWVGTRWGRRPFLGGTGEGTVAFAVVAGAILLLRHEPVVAIAVALVAALTERRSWPLDDNLTVPVVCAALLTLLGA